MTSTVTDARPELRGAALAVALTGVSAACWFVAAHQMRGMDMGPGSSLGSLSFFTASWATMSPLLLGLSMTDHDIMASLMADMPTCRAFSTM